MSSQITLVSRGRTDERDWLVEADEPLAGLQLRNGGEIPGRIVAPALLEMVRKAREFGLRTAKAISARDNDEAVTAWVEIEPQSDGKGCALKISNWQSEPAKDCNALGERARLTAMARQFAELTAQLGSQQEILSVESDCAELQQLASQMREGLGLPWTDFVEFPGNSHKQPVHWRLLDGAKLRLEGSERDWRALLIPLGQPASGSDGFELFLSAQQPLSDSARTLQADAARSASKAPPGIGLEVAPVLRQPVSRIIANAETIRTQLAGPIAEEYSNYAADIASAGEHLLALIDDLTTLEMVEDEAFDPAPDKIDLADVALRAAGILGVRAQERGISLNTPKPGETAPAIGEFRRVLQILLNLLGNAIRYAPDGSLVTLHIESDGHRALVSVSDEGEGLSEEEQSRAFSKFERLGRTGDGGSGLGLYISRRLAEAMQGNLTVESTKGHGACFTLELPADALRASAG